MNRVGMMLAVAAAMAASSGAVAQQQGSDGEAFLTAIRDQDGAKATEIAGRNGATVVNYRSYDGDIALTVAMAKRSAQYVSFLLSKGAEPNLANKRGDTPLVIAARSGFAEGVEMMLGARAAIDAPNRQGETPLIVAVQGRHARIVRRLLEAGANPDKADIAAGFSARDYARRDSRNPELLRLIETVKSARKVISGPTR